MTYFEAGKYLVEITAQGFDESKEKKTPFFWLTFVPLGMINPEDPNGPLIPCNEYEREIRLWLTERAAPYTITRLRSLGWTGESFAELEPGGDYSFVGKTVRLRCSHRHDGDKTYDHWEFPPVGSDNHHSHGVAKKLDQLFGNELKKTSGKVTRRVKRQLEPVGVGYDEELPF